MTEPNLVVPIPPILLQNETIPTTDSFQNQVPELPPRRAGLRSRELLKTLQSNEYPSADYLLTIQNKTNSSLFLPLSLKKKPTSPNPT